MNKKVIGYTTGVFDMFHIGHLNILRNAKSMCDSLIVGVTTDELVEQKKNTSCIIPYEQRIEIVRSIVYVDTAIPQNSMDKMAAWEKIKFDIMFVGDDWYKSEKWNKLESDFKKINVQIIYFPYTSGIRSSELKEKLYKIHIKNEIQEK